MGNFNQAIDVIKLSSTTVPKIFYKLYNHVQILEKLHILSTFTKSNEIKVKLMPRNKGETF